MIENIIFYFIFLAQIILLSYYYPAKIIDRFRKVFENYPPDKYPKLYPKDDNFYKVWLYRYRITNIAILFIGFIILFTMVYQENFSESIDFEIITLIYFLIQNVPLYFMEIGGCSYFKLMRKADTRTTRKAELQPRYLTKYVSPFLIGLAIFTNISALLFFFIIEDFHFSVGSDTFIILLTLLASNGFYVGIIYWNIYGRKLDPYQDSKDRFKQIELTVQSLVFMSIIASIFIVTNKIINHIDLSLLEPIIMSLYLQLIMVIGLGTIFRKLRIENMNFDVYKVNSSDEDAKQYRNITDTFSIYRTIVGLFLGLIIGSALGMLIIFEGGTIKGFALPAIFGTILGTILGGYFEVKRNFNK